MKAREFVCLLALTAPLVGCASARVTSLAARPYAGPKIGAIAISPGGGVLAEAIGVELFNLGFRVIDPEQTSRMIGRIDSAEIEVGTPKSFQVLRTAGADAVLIVKAVNGYDGNPTSASARVIGLAEGDVVAGVSWQNGSCGQEGSPCDRHRRKNTSVAALNIAQELRTRLGR